MTCKFILQIIQRTMIFCNSFYDQSIQDFMDDFIEKGLQTKSRKEFILQCIYDLDHYTYSENDHKITDKYNLLRHMLKYHTPEKIFHSMNGKNAAEVFREFNEIDFIEEMLTDSINLEDMVCFYYIAFLHHNKKSIIRYLLRWII